MASGSLCPTTRLFASCHRGSPASCLLPLCLLPELQHWAPSAPLGREMFSLSPPFPARQHESGFPCALPPSASGTAGKCIKGLGKAAVRVTRSHSWIQLLI